MMLNLVKLVNILTLVSTAVDIGTAIVPKVVGVFKKPKPKDEAKADIPEA